MKKIFAAVCLFGLVACNAIEQPETPVLPENGNQVVFALGGEVANPSIVTKSTSAASETAVSTYKVVLFKSGAVYAMADATAGASTVAVNVEDGTYNCWAIVNAPAGFSVSMSTTEAQLAAMTSAITDNTMSKFVMTGVESNKAITSSTGTVTIPVYRHICKVEVDKISANFDGTYYDGKTLTVNKIYLTNVSNAAKFDHTPSTSALNGTWYNKLVYTSNTLVNSFLYEAPSGGITINDNTSNSTARYFYPYPNASTNTAACSSWPTTGNPPCTRLVFECSLDGDTCYYHIDIPNMACNTLYKITECTIKNMGGKDPEHNLETTSINFKISVQNWATGFTSSFTFDDSGCHQN